MVLAAVGCEKINQPSSKSLKFHVDVENMGVGTKAGGSGPSEFYMLGRYIGQYNNPAFYPDFGSTDPYLKKYSLDQVGDYVIEGGTTVEDNPEWCLNKKSSFWACTAWGVALPDVAETVNYTIYQKDSFKANVMYSGTLGEITYDMTDASNQTDYMVAYSEMTQGETIEDDILHLHFYHTLSKINFVDKTNGQIKSLKVDRTYNGGKVSVSKNGESTWQITDDTFVTKTISSFNESMYLIPQGTASKKHTINITAILDDNSERLISIDVAWLAGYEYTYGLNLATNGDANSGVATKSSNLGDSDFFIECISEKKY